MASPCIVAFCKNIGSHRFPKNEERRKQWVEAITQIKPGLSVRKYSLICSAHFRPTDFSKTPLSCQQPDLAPRILKKSAVPTIFPWGRTETSEYIEDTPSTSSKSSNFSSTIAEREIPALITPSTSQGLNINFNPANAQKTYFRAPPIAFVEEQTYLQPIEDDMQQDPLNLNNGDNTEQEGCSTDIFYEDDYGNSIVEMDIGDDNDIASYHEGRDMYVEKHDISVQTDECNTTGFSIQNYKCNDDAIHFYTGLESFNKLMLVFRTLGSSAKDLNYIYGPPPPELHILDIFFIVLIILRRHKAMKEISMMYQISIKQVYNIFITWVRFISLQWKNLDLWVNKETVTSYMPLDFHDKFPSTRVILDATECPVKKSKLPLAQQITFSTYKNRNTVKVLIGMAPSGLITFVSPCYGGSATDRQIIERSSILERFDYNDEIMVDKGLNVQDIFISFGVKVNMPAFFKKGSQIGSETLLSNRKVASKRVHIERIIGMMKTYKILSTPMNLTEILLSSDILFIVAMLVNFRTNIMNKND